VALDRQVLFRLPQAMRLPGLSFVSMFAMSAHPSDGSG
jgi:hypothetical protein